MKRFYIGMCVITICIVNASSAFAQPNDLYNPNFASGINGWHGIGEVVYLRADGKESHDPVKGAIPVLKIPLKTTESREISQEFTTADEPTQLHMHLEMKKSSDFKSDAIQDTPSPEWQSVGEKGAHPNQELQSDFCVRLEPGTASRTVNASSKWTPIDFTFKHIAATRYRVICFCVPCGKGSIYVRNTLVSSPQEKSP